MDNNLINKKTSIWMSMERATKEQRDKAEEYYEKELMPLIIETFINKEKYITNKPEYMILSVGTSYEPLVLSLKLLNPNKGLFLYTETTEEKIDKILEFVNLKPSQFNKEKVEETNSLIIYQKIKKAYLEWGKPEKIYVDFTGGTKAMSAATAMAGAILGAQLVYIGNEKYLKDFRKPYPGTEFLEKVQNPYNVFGDIEEERANDLLNQHDYVGARKIFESLVDKVPDPNKKEYFYVIYLINSAYEYWDSLEFNKALSNMNEAVEEIEKYSSLNSRFIMSDKLELFKKQSELLEIMTNNTKKIKKNTSMEMLFKIEEILPLMFTVYHNAKRRSEQEKYDMASLLLYRLLEMIMQRRLAIYGIDVSKPIYNNIGEFNKFKNKVIEYRKKVYGTNINTNLPNNITLMEGYIQLAALKDELMNEIDKIKFLKDIFNKIKIRNYNIFAHGFYSLNKKEYKDFENFVINVFEHFCKIEKVDKKKYEYYMKFIHPKESRCY